MSTNKPPEIVRELYVNPALSRLVDACPPVANLRLIFDAQSGQLKAAEVLTGKGQS